MTNSFVTLNRLRVMRRGHSVYDQKFHSGVNIIRGENGSGKSTIADFIFYAMGGEFDKWKREASLCDEVQAEVTTLHGVLTVKREVGRAQTPIQVFFGNMSDAEKHALDSWSLHPIRRSDSRESFSQIMFRSAGIPEAQSQGAANITMNQILRLLYSDQRTPAPLLFRYEGFDTREIREAVGDLLCGLSVYELYDIELELRDLNNQFDDHSRKLTSLLDSISGSDGLYNIETLDFRVLESEREIENLRIEIESVDLNIEESQTREFLQARKKKIDELSLLKSKLRDAELLREKLSYELKDLNDFGVYIKDLLSKVSQASATAEIIGHIEFAHCPACLKPLNTDIHESHCIVCCQEMDPDVERSKFLQVHMDLVIQSRETTQLIDGKQLDLDHTQSEIRSLRRQYSSVLSEYSVRFDMSISPRESYLAERNRNVGQIENELNHLQQVRERLLAVEKLRAEKAELQASIQSLKDRKAGLEQEGKNRRSVAMTEVSDIAKRILSEDLERQEEFASPGNVTVGYGDNSVEVDGEMNFAESSNVVLKNSAILALFSAATVDKKFHHPRFLLLDNVEDKGMEQDRSHNFQEIILARSEEAMVDHQIIFTTSMINPRLDIDELTIGPYYTHTNKTLDFS